MGLRLAQGDLALTLAAAGSGVVTSGPVASAGAAADVILLVHTTAATGTGPTLTCSLEESDTGSGGWTAVPGSSTAAVAGVGNGMANARVTKNYVRVSATVGGTTPAVTGRASVLMFAD